MDCSRMDSISSADESRSDRHRSHWTMKYDGRSVRSLKTQALIHHAQTMDDDDSDVLPSYMNGPVSVQEADVIRMNNTTNGSTSAITTTNHVGPAGNESAKRGRTKDEIKADNSHYVKSIKNEVESRKKDLTPDQVKEKVFSAVTELKNMEEYHHGDGVKYQKIISDIYWDFSSERTMLGNYLADLGYAELTIAMLKQLNGLGIFKNDDIWLPAYYTYKTCWNYSDASEKLSMCLADSGIVKLMTLNLGHKPYLDNMHSKNVYYILKASLSTLHNIARCAGVIQHFRDIKTAEVILSLINANDEFLKSMAMLTLVYLVDEKESAKYIDETNIIKSIIHLLHKALENKQKGRFHGLTPTELTQGLSRLSISDLYKAKIIDGGALPELVLMLQSTDPEEQAASSECLWNFSFDRNVRQTLTDFPELMVTMEKLKDCENQTVKKNVRGALWLIKGEIDQFANSSRQQAHHKSKNHIFISFSLNEKDLVKKLCANLAVEGYQLWVDWEQMGGSSLQSMAKAVESSAVVLICMSEQYKLSPSCRTEAEYTLRLGKDYLLLMKQKNYHPDGWLGVVLGSNMFFDFSGKYPYDKSLQGLLKELKGRGVSTSPAGQHQGVSLDEVAAPLSTTHTAFAKTTSTSLSSSSPSLSYSNNNNSNSAALTSMSNEHVENWLVSKGLQRLTSAFSQIDGQLIWQLKRMRETTPEYFYSILERQFGMTLIDILRFNAALDTLQ